MIKNKFFLRIILSVCLFCTGSSAFGMCCTDLEFFDPQKFTPRLVGNCRFSLDEVAGVSPFEFAEFYSLTDGTTSFSHATFGCIDLNNFPENARYFAEEFEGHPIITILSTDPETGNSISFSQFHFSISNQRD